MHATDQPISGVVAEASTAADEVLMDPDAMDPRANGLGYALTLYVASLTPRSVDALKAITALCEKHLKGRYTLDVIDIYERPSLAKRDQILAAPTLIKRLPLPLRRLIGDMADEHRVLLGLDLCGKGNGIHQD